MPELHEILKTDEFVSDIELRREAAKTLSGFCATYLSHHFKSDLSDFYFEMSSALEDYQSKRVVMIGFRGCAKSTMASLALPLWMALEHPEQYPFIVMLAATQTQASINSASVQHELKSNELILRDYGHLKYKKVDDPSPEPTLEGDQEWQAMNIVLDNGVRILSRSRGQQIRGLKHRQHRPKAIIADDIEDLEGVRTIENRDKTDRWMRGNVMPSLSDPDGRLIVIGNWLHTDGILARLKKTGRFSVLEFPLIDEKGKCTWPAKYPTQKSLDDKRDEMGDIGFRREMLLQIVPEEGQDVLPEDISYYDELPFNDGNYLAHGVDLAISTKESADSTACISGEVTWPNGVLEIYVLPNPLIRRMTFNDTMTALDNIRHSNKMTSEFFVEAVAFQQVAIEEMERRAFSVQAMRPTKDKRSRLRVAARYIKNGTVKFPRKGCEELLTQLLGFGIEKHDDAVDALVYMILGVAQGGISPQEIKWVG